MSRRPPTPDEERGDAWAYAPDHGLVDEDRAPQEVRGAPVEPVLHAPTTTHIEPRPVATGECTVETVAGEPLCDDEDVG